MTWFRWGSAADELVGPYPSFSILDAALREESDVVRSAILRLWHTEGIPYAFRNSPLLYESARSFLAQQLGIATKNVTIIGSARTGYSLEAGAPLRDNSDLDFTAISNTLFDQLNEAFTQWASDFDRGEAVPRNANENRYWSGNREVVPRNIARGFVDPYKIPLRYGPSRAVAQALFGMHRKLSSVDETFKPRQASLRVYRDWAAMEKQTLLNVRYSFARRK